MGERTVKGWKLWGLWTLANAVGWAVALVGAAVGAMIVFGLFTISVEIGGGMEILEQGLNSGLQWALGTLVVAGAGAVAGAIAGLVLGIAQWLVLRRTILGTRLWVWTTAAGLAGGMAIGLPVGMGARLPRVLGLDWVLEAAIAGIAAGLLIGLAQWFVLRRRVAHAGWWILASALAWGVGFTVGIAGGAEVGGRGGMPNEPWDQFFATVFGLACGALLVPGALSGAITGGALACLARGHDQPIDHGDLPAGNDDTA